MTIRIVALAVFFSLAVAPAANTQAPPPLRGFTVQSSAAQRAAENTFRAVPKPENAREYMRVIAAHPHHAGSPGSRAVADYILGQFTSWGLNAQIESFEALMPYPTERLVEMVAPERYTLKLAEPPLPQDPTSDDPSGLPTEDWWTAAATGQASALV